MHLLEKHSAIIPVEGKAIQWLKTFCESEEWVEIRSSNHTSDRRDIPLLDIELNVVSNSEREYELSICVGIGDEGFVEMFQPKLRGRKNLSGVTSEQMSYHGNDEYWCDLCVQVVDRHNSLPFGDHLMSMALSLRNDVETAKHIQLLDLFLAHDEHEHLWLEGYYITGPETGIYDPDEQQRIPIEIRTLCHKFACLNDELACSVFGALDRILIVEEEMKSAAAKIRERKQASY